MEQSKSKAEIEEEMDIEDRTVYEQERRDQIAIEIENFLEGHFTFVNDGPE